MPTEATLSPESRAKLDGIVSQMVAAGETDDFIQSVVDDFKTKYSAGTPGIHPPPLPKGLQPPGFTERTLKNLPGSAWNFIQQPFPGMPGGNPANFDPKTDMLGAAWDSLKNLGHAVANIPETFEHDPVGTTALPFQLMRGHTEFPEVLPTAARTARGAWEGATAPATIKLPAIENTFTLPASVAGALVGGGVGALEGGLGHVPHVGPIGGAAVGAVLPPIRGAWRGFKNEPVITPEVPPAPKPVPVPPIRKASAPPAEPVVPPPPIRASTPEAPGSIVPIPPIRAASMPETGPIVPVPPIRRSAPVPETPIAPEGAVKPVGPMVPGNLQTQEFAPVTGYPARYQGHSNPTQAWALDKKVAAQLIHQPGFHPDTMTLEQVNAARKTLGSRPILEKDWETRRAQLRGEFQ